MSEPICLLETSSPMMWMRHCSMKLSQHLVLLLELQRWREMKTRTKARDLALSPTTRSRHLIWPLNVCTINTWEIDKLQFNMPSRRIQQKEKKLAELRNDMGVVPSACWQLSVKLSSRARLLDLLRSSQIRNLQTLAATFHP